MHHHVVSVGPAKLLAWPRGWAEEAPNGRRVLVVAEGSRPNGQSRRRRVIDPGSRPAASHAVTAAAMGSPGRARASGR